VFGWGHHVFVCQVCLLRQVFACFDRFFGSGFHVWPFAVFFFRFRVELLLLNSCQLLGGMFCIGLRCLVWGVRFVLPSVFVVCCCQTFTV